MAAEDGGEQNASGSWVDSYVASYRYGYTWAAAIIPMIGLLGFFLARQSKQKFRLAQQDISTIGRRSDSTPVW